MGGCVRTSQAPVLACLSVRVSYDPSPPCVQIIASKSCLVHPALGLDAVARSEGYQSLLARAARLVIFDEPCERPAPRAQKGHLSGGGKFVDSPSGILGRQCGKDKLLFWETVKRERYPSQDDKLLSAPTLYAIRHTVLWGEGIAAWREERLECLRQLSHEAEWLTELLRGMQPPSVRQVAGQVNLGLMCVLCDVLPRADTAFPAMWVRGFPIIGAIPDSGVFRPQSTAATLDASKVLAANELWNQELERIVAHSAKAAAGRGDADLLRQYEAATQKEVQKGYMSGPYTRKQLDDHFGGKGKYRGIGRFGTRQGSKVRPIDNAKRSLHNAITWMLETIAPDDADWPIRAALELARTLLLAGYEGESVRILLALDDIAAAYRHAAYRVQRRCKPVTQQRCGLCECARLVCRRVPTDAPHLTVVCMWSSTANGGRGGVVWYRLLGHNFGLISAVSRCPYPEVRRRPTTTRVAGVQFQSTARLRH